jgi:hypothetical protein
MLFRVLKIPARDVMRKESSAVSSSAQQPHQLQAFCDGAALLCLCDNTDTTTMDREERAWLPSTACITSAAMPETAAAAAAQHGVGSGEHVSIK